jgi:hypothetical protein
MPVPLYKENIHDILRTSDYHTVRFPFCEVVYWNNGLAASNVDPWTSVVVQRGPAQGIEIVASETQNQDRCRHLLYDMLMLLHHAYEQGARDRSKQFRDLLEAAKDNSFGPRS